MIDTAGIVQAIAHAEALRDKYKALKDWENRKFWKQEVYRLQSDLLRAERINQANQ